MYINVGNNLFMPEGDDYSKTEFSKVTEEINLEGNAVLQQLRLQQAAEQLLRPKPIQKKVDKSDKSQNIEKKKLSYKEILDQVVASK
ncbi:hypothetical protein [Aminipila sp.]|uniref:hypothetical protein n=1 Tax=Aminipila sp. TaxID=2060095 RepID=UPI0028A19FF5|nr:hypothetical protein [Aminipila sp.]